MLSVTFLYRYAEFHYAECCYAEFRCAVCHSAPLHIRFKNAFFFAPFHFNILTWPRFIVDCDFTIQNRMCK
jgi:hypothetical protein